MEDNKTLMEKYFPKSWDDVKLPTRIKTLLTTMQNQSGYRLLLHSSPGTGKTTTARIMVSDTSKYEVMYLSGSNDFKIDTMRQKVMQFSSGFSVSGKNKVIIIDECENIRNDLQDSFKIILDQCKTVSFIFITNEIEKVNTAVRSRCTCLEYDFSGVDLEEQQQNFIKFAVQICKEEGIEYDAKGIKQLYIRLFPDFRHLIVSLQQMKDTNNAVTFDNVKKLSDNGKQMIDLYTMITDVTITGRKLYEDCSKLKGKERECFISLGEPFFEYLNDQEKYDKTLQVAVIVAKYSEMFVTSINKFVTFMGCITELKSIFR
jgi:replication factor C subunit 3/5